MRRLPCPRKLSHHTMNDSCFALVLWRIPHVFSNTTDCSHV